MYHDTYHANVLVLSFAWCSRACHCDGYSSVARQTDILHRGKHKFVPECPMRIHHPSLLLKQLLWFLESVVGAPDRLPPRALGGGIILWHTCIHRVLLHFPAAFQISTRLTCHLFNNTRLIRDF